MFTVPRAALAAGGIGETAHAGGHSMSEKVPIIVVLGVDVDQKPHGSRFEERDAPFVQRAAELMGFHVMRIAPDNEELYALAAGLPVGKIFATGRAFVPFVSRAAFDKLAVLVEGGVTVETRATGHPPPRIAAMFTEDAADAANELWAKIEVGTVVLAAADPELYGQSWWEAVVVSIDDDDLTLRWVEDPTEEPFAVPRRDVGLRHPAPME
jgi:hypothetical protein